MMTIRRYAYAPGSRRRLLLAFIAAIVLAASRGTGPLGLLQAEDNPILAENLLPGDTDWDISGSGDESIQGFASDMSVNVGGVINFKINTLSTDYRIDIYRLGYYGGLGARRVATVQPSAPLPQSQPNCLTEVASGLVDCGNWAVSASWAVPAAAVSGVYIARPTREDGAFIGAASHIVFIVRNDSQQADILFQTSDTTWQAYNNYGGNNLYCGNPISNAGSAYGCAGRAAKVSYNRPFTTRVSSNPSWLFSAEYPMLRFLEANGFNVKYWSGVDTDRLGANPTVGLTSAKKPKVFLSVGHDEYWSGTQRLNVESARNAGVSLAFMSGNEVFWKTRWETSIDGTGTSHRTLVSYKDTLSGIKLDPLAGVTTGTWRDTRFGPPNDGGRPENALIGSLWTVNSGTSSISVPASMKSLRLWRNTRVAALPDGQSTSLGVDTLGYEWGEVVENGFQPAGLVRLSSTTVTDVEKIIDFGATVGRGPATHNLTLYRHNSGALVFGASTVQWSWGLDGNHDGGSPATHPPDQAIQQATVNLLADMGVQPASLQVGADPARPLVTSPASSDQLAPTSAITFPIAGGTVESGSRIMITGTAADAGGGAVGGVEVSVDGGTTWRRATGTSSWSIEWTPGAVGTATIRTRATDDNGNLESAGPGIGVQVIIGECPCPSLWRSSAAPSNSTAGGEWELGVKFTSDVGGFITGLRFYKDPSGSGTHEGHLWTSTGERLATATFTNETSAGWQQVNFSSPVAIQADTIYVASYHVVDGTAYSYSPGYFTNAGINSPPLRAPATGPAGGNGVYREGAVGFPTQTFNGNNYWIDVVFAASLVDTTPPVISNVKTTTIDSSRVTVTWTTSELSNSRIDYGTNPAILTATLANLPPGTLTVTNNSAVTQHSIALTGLQPNTTYYQLVSSTDASSNRATVAPPTFTVPGPTLRDTASSDFGAGTATNTYVSQTADGEIILAPTAGAEFNGTSLTQGWIETPWSTEGYSMIVDGVLLVDGARVATCVINQDGACLPETTRTTPSAIYSAPRTLEFSANFSGDSFQHAGFGVTFNPPDGQMEPWAIFSTSSGGTLFARTLSADGIFANTDLGPAPLGEFHTYRIEWKATSVDFYIDGILKTSHPVTIATPMRPVAASDFNPFGGIVFVDWMRLTPMASPGSFESRVFDATLPVDWKSIQWAAQTPTNTSLAISVRTGDTPAPDTTWTAFVPVAEGAINLRSRYIQYRADMASSNQVTTPVLEDIVISTGNAPIAVPDFAAVARNSSRVFPASGPGSLTFNDSDADVNDSLRIVGISTPSHGTVVLHADGSVTYTPTSLYEGADAFVYTISDGLLTASATVSIDVRFGNIAPVAINNFYAAVEDTTLTVPAAAGLLANDSDADNDVLQAQLVTLPVHGQLALSANGGFSYTPAVNYAGPDTFSYRAFDGTGYSAEAIVQLEIAQVNDAPFTEPDAYTAVLDQPLDVPAPGVLANDHDVEVENTAPLRTLLVSGVSHGQLILRADGSFSYVPVASFLGTDSFTYKAVDSGGAVSVLEKTVTLTVASKAAAGTVDAGATVSTGSGVSVDDPLSSSVRTPTPATVRIAQGVISGSQSPAGYTFLNRQVNIDVTDASGAEVIASPANPLVLNFQIDLSLVPAGQDHTTFEVFRNNVRVPDCLGATAIPAANLDPCVSARSGGDRISLTILSSHASKWNMGLDATSLGGELIATNGGPYVTNFQVPFGKTAPGVLGNDFGPSTISAKLFGTPAGGTVVLNPSGAYTFTPHAGHCGPASFQYKAVNGVVESREATVSIVVNCAPDAVSDTVSVVEDNATTITVLSNDTDPDVQPLTITAVTQAANGSVAIVAGSKAVSYTPAANFFGSDSFTYTIQDPRGDSDTATVNLTVVPVNDAPSFVVSSDQTVAEDAGPQVVPGLATAISAGPANENAQAVSFLISNTNNALFSAQPAVAANGVLTYTAAANAYGAATVTLRIRDDGGVVNGGVDTSAPRTFVITVTPVNDNPIANADSATVPEDSGVTNIAVRNNDTIGPDVGEALTVTAVSVAAHGTSAVTATGVSYAPAANYFGPDSFTYTISDGNGGTATATVSINVTPVNDNPIANADSATVPEDSGITNIAVRNNDTIGPDVGETLTVTAVSAAANGTPAVTATGVSYAPAANYFGPDSFTYTISDGNGGTATATVSINVTAVNDNPVANADSVTVPEDSGATNIAVRSNDTIGPDVGETLTVTAVTAAAHGTSAVTATGVSYAPAADYFGPDSFTYTISDGNGGTATAIVSVMVTQIVPTTTSKPATSLTPAAYGTNLTFTTTVTGAGGTPTGLVEFFDGIVSLGTAPLNAAGTASKTTNAVAAGTRTITAKYLGDTRFAPSTSLPLTQTVTGVAAAVTTTLTVAPVSPQYSDRVTFNATVTPATVGGQPAARVALFKVGAEVIGTAPLTLNTATGKLEAALNAPLVESTAGAMRPGIKTAAVEFVDVSPGYTIASKTASVTVKAEDALTAYTGPAQVVTSTGAATIRLEARVSEIADGDLGDVRTATVAFVNRTTGATIGTGILDTTKSTATVAYYYFNYAVNIGTSASQTFTIGQFVNGYYTRNATADNGTTIVKKP